MNEQGQDAADTRCASYHEHATKAEADECDDRPHVMPDWLDEDSWGY